MQRHAASCAVTSVLAIALLVAVACSAAVSADPLYAVHEVVFEGPRLGPTDTPARDVELLTVWRHESGAPAYRIYGFWDGDGQGGSTGNVFKVRFCSTAVGQWTLIETTSNQAELRGQNEGYTVTCAASDHPGFWIADRRWYKRSDGSHPYIFGNTMYSFLSEYDDKGPTGSHIAADIRGNARYFKKVRFAITADRYPHPQAKPFLDDAGHPTDNGNFSHRPNPAWFGNRVDLAVQTAYAHDLIADLILNGPDTEASRSVLRAARNDGDATPILKYIAARYGSYPNVWICLANEFDIKTPNYTCNDIAGFGTTLRRSLPYPTPMSVHAKPRNWYAELNTPDPWHDHVIIQSKLKRLPEAADWVSRNHGLGGHVPVIDDELAYEGAGDGWSEADVIEAHLGAFLGGGYGTTGHKPASKRGHYFFGNFRAAEHQAADNLLWLRQVIDADIAFWQMAPMPDPDPTDATIGPFASIAPGFRAMAWAGREYVLGTNQAQSGIIATLPPGRWTVTRYDAMAADKHVVQSSVSGTLAFDAPPARAVLFHFKRIDRP